MKSTKTPTPINLCRFFFILTLIVTLAIRVHAGNILPNGDFEQSEGNEPKGWKVTGNTVPSSDPEGGFINGKTSLHLKHSVSDITQKSTEIIAFSPNLDAPKGETDYRLTFFAKSPYSGQPIIVYVWMTGKRKKTLSKKKPFILTENWAKYEFPFRLPASSEWDKVNLKFYIHNGEVLLDDILVEEGKGTAKSTVDSELQTQKNLVVNPGFELGWLGWGTSTYGPDDRSYAFPETPPGIDTSVKYEGNSSLRIEPETAILSRRFKIEMGETYVMSFYARATPNPSCGDNHHISAFVLTPLWKKKNISLEVGKDVGTEWKRFSIPFSFPDQGSAFNNTVYVRFDSHDNTLWVDGVQIEKEKATEFDIGVQAGIVNTNDKGLYSLNEPGQVSVALTSPGGIQTPLQVTATARDLFSKILWQQKLSFPTTPNEVSKLPLTLENKQLGVIEITLEVSKPGEPPVSANTWRYCVIDGKPENTRKNLLFATENGVGWNQWNEKWNEEMANVLGSAQTRVFVWWQGDDKNDPPTTEALEKFKQELLVKKNSGKTNLILIHWPRNFRLRPGMTLDRDLTEQEEQEEIAKYERYCTKIVSYLKDTVDYYQIMGEANIWSAHAGALKGAKIMPAERYAKFVIAGSKAIKKAYPQAKVVWNVNGMAYQYVEKMFQCGVAPYVDAGSFHAYRQSPENSPLYENLVRLRQLVDKYTPGQPLLNPEQYYGVRDLIANQSEEFKDYYADTEEDQCGRILQNYLHHIAAGKMPFYIFAVHATLYHYGMSNPTYFYDAFGGYRFMSQTLYDIDGATNVVLNPAVRAFIFSRHDGTKIVSLNTKTFGVKGGLRNCAAESAYDVNGNPVTITDIPLSYNPSYLLFKGKSEDQVLSELKKGDFYGFDAPMRASFSLENGTLTVDVENCSNKSLDGTLQFTSVSNNIKLPTSVPITGLESGKTKQLTFPVGIKEIAWDQSFKIQYRLIVGDSIVTKTAKLPSLFVGKSTKSIDGKLDEWKNDTTFSLGEDHLTMDLSNGKQKHNGSKDLSANVSMSWDEDNLYCAVKVTDDQFVHGKAGTPLHQWDSVQVYFDMKNDGGKTYDDNDAEYTIGFNESGNPVAYLNRGPTGRYVGGDNQTTGIDTEVKVGFKKTDDGYILELAFPRSTLPFIDLKEGSVFGFSLMVNDNDGQDLKYGVTMAAKGTSPTHKPDSWTAIKLTGSK